MLLYLYNLSVSNKLEALSLPDVAFIMLINLMHFNIYELDKFRSQLSWAWKNIFNLGARSHEMAQWRPS